MNDETRWNETPPAANTPEVAAALDAGLAALKRKAYDDAIAHLEAVAQSGTDRSAALKAQMALIKAYAASGDFETAIACCQSLCHHSSLKVRQWATDLLPDLLQRQSRSARTPIVEDAATTQPPAEDVTGFVPLGASPQSNPPGCSDPADPPPQVDGTGFVPRSAASSAIPVNDALSEADDSTGFTPFTASPDPLATDSNPFQLPSDFSDDVDAGFTPFHLAETASGPEDATQEQGSTTHIQAEAEGLAPFFTTSASGTTSAPEVDLAERAPGGDASPDSVSYPIWTRAGRAQRWTSLGAVDRSTLWGVAALSAIAPVVLLWVVATAGMALFNQLLQRLFWLVNLTSLSLYGNPLWLIVLGVLVLYGVTPWLLDTLLTTGYGARPLSVELLSRYSAESTRLLRRLSSQHRYPLPTLQLLPTRAPVVMTYGNLRRNARMVVSQGVLDVLQEDEIAALLATQMAHLQTWDFTVLSGITLLLQLPYQLYWAVASWGDRQSNTLLQGLAVGVSSLAYGLYWVLRWSGLWLSRLRHFYSDRLSSELTGNPNGLARALLKLTLGLADEIQRQRHTPPLLASFELLMPVGHRTALTLGSVSQQVPLEPLLDWERRNPYRRWLSVSQAHPPLGDRLQHLTAYALRWRLASEFDLAPPPRSAIAALQRRREYLLQIAPFAGLLGGIALAWSLWMVGAVGDRLFQATNLSWLWGDWPLLRGCALIGFSMGLFIRINQFYPDIKPKNTQIDPSLAEILTDAYALPIDSQPVRMQGTLLGCRGIANILGQDLILNCESGLVRLHFVSPLGTPGNIIPQGAHPYDAVGQRVMVTGWLHRGATPWIDVETIRPQRGRLLKSSHPLWLTFLATAAALSGLMIILRGV